MSTFKMMIFIIISLWISLIIYTLTSNLWFFRKEDRIGGSKELIISQVLRLAYSCYEKNFNVRGSVICERMEIVLNEDILASEILSKLDRRKISEDDIFVEDLSANSKIIIRYENGKIFIEEEKYEVISS